MQNITGKIFSIATEYQANLTTRVSSIKQNQPHPINNIFEKNLLTRQAPQDIFNSKKYEIVGLKELKSFENKLRKGKKNTHKKETYLKEDSSRQDGSEKLLTKNEVMNSLPKIQLKKMLREHFRTEMTQVDLNRFSSHHLKIEGSNHNFSLGKLKNAMKLRKEEWKKMQIKTGREDSKFPSVYKSIDAYRSKIQEKLKNTKLQDFSNQNSKKWPIILRGDLSLAEVTLKKSVVRTFHDEGEFTTRGHSKQKAEQRWLQSKYEDGYYFKKLASKEDSIQAKPVQSVL